MTAPWIPSAVSVLLFAAVSAHAQDAADTKAREHFKVAQAAYNLGQFDRALEGYSAAYAAKPLPAFLFNIAQCHKQLGSWEQAAFFYKRFIATGDDSVDREKVQQLIAQMEQKQAETARLKDAASMQAHTLELERAREATARAEAEAAAQRVAEAAAAAKLRETQPAQVPLYQRWWLWAGIGAVVAVGAAVTSVAIVTRPQAEAPSYGTVNAR